MKGVVEGFWDCPYCGTNRIRGRYYYCPNCGKGRGQETKFYPPERITKADLIDDREEIKNPDQYCEYCDSYINFKFNYCPNCGAERGKKDYFKVRAEKESKGTEREVITEDRIDYVEAHFERYEDKGDEEDEKEVYNDIKYLVDKKNPEERYSKEIFGNNEKSRNTVTSFFSRNKKTVLIIAAVLAVISFITIILIPRNEEIDVIGKSWKRTIAIESHEWIEHSDWSLPAGARLKYSNSEIHHYEKVFDHTESYHESHKERYISGYKTVTRDRGNGYFEVDEEPIYSYRTVYETKQRDVYRDEPVYKTKYYYEIQEWVYNRSYHSSGTTDEPYWPEIELANNDERERSRDATYTIIGMKNGKRRQYTASLEIWQKIDIGQTYEFEIVLGTIKEIVENDKNG